MEKRFTRREAVALMGSATALAVLPGCGGSGGGTPAPRTAIVSGHVDLTQIGGAGLKVLTMDGAAAPISSAGTYSQTASVIQPQAHILVDSTGAARSFAVTVGPGTTSVSHSATSTATALVFLSLGIITTDPAQATTRIQRIQALPAFAPLQAFLVNNLPTASINALGSNAQLVSLLTACVTAYFAANRTVRPSYATVAAVWNGSAVTITNSGWRYVQVVREDMDGQANDLGPDDAGFSQSGVLPAGIVAGVTGASLGDIFAQQTGEPSTISDSGNFSLKTNNLAQVTYWIEGLGGVASGLTPPADVASQFTGVATAATIYNYVFLPLLDLVAGVLDTFLDGAKVVAALTKADLQLGLAGSFAALGQAISSGDTAGIVSALANILAALAENALQILSIVLATSGVNSVLTAVEIAAVGAELSLFLEGLAIGFAAVNLGEFFSQIGTYSDTSKYTLSISAGGGTIS